MMSKRTVCGLLALALVCAVGAESVRAQSFTAIRIGDFDGLGFGTGTGYVAANGGPVNIDGLGILADGDFIPDLNQDGSVATGSGDDFDNRSTAEIAGNYTEGEGFSAADASSGSQFTDIALSTSFDATFGTPNDFPAPPSASLSNQPGFVFDFMVAGSDIIEGQELFLNVVFGDYDVTPANLLLTRADRSTETRALNVQPGGQDGLLQAAFGPLAFADVFTAMGSDWKGYLEVDFVAPGEPYTVFDYAEISTTPVIGGPLEIECPPTFAVDCGGSTDPSVTGNATATGGFPPLTITFSDVMSADTITRTWTVTDAQANTTQCTQIITVLAGGAEGHIAGTVSADCSVLGITIEAYDDSGYVVGYDVTDVAGDYLIPDVPSGATYRVSVVMPIGYGSAQGEMFVTVDCGDTARADFELICPDDPGEQRSIGFWKHQFRVATGSPGHGHIDPEELCDYLDMIESHYNNHPVNAVVVYEPPASGRCVDKLEVGRVIIDLKGRQEMVTRARQQLFALLLNVVSGKLSQSAIISDDGATVSQAITYCDQLIDDPAGKHEKAKTIADWINNGMMVPADMIPLVTDDIAYRSEVGGPAGYGLNPNYPNPFNAATEIRFRLTEASFVTLDVYNVLGQRMATLVEGYREAGVHTILWDGQNAPSGVYFYRLQAGDLRQTRRMMLLK